jgi:hypothetical protein
MYQPSLAFFQESLGTSRKKATTLMVSICVAGSFLVMYFSKDGVFQDTIDNWVGTYLIFILAMVQIICFSWVFGVDRGLKEAHEGAHMRIGPVFRFVMKYVTPTYLLIVFVAFTVKSLPGWIDDAAGKPAATGALALILAVTLLLVVSTRIGEKRWRAAGLDVDGQHPPAD